MAIKIILEEQLADPLIHYMPNATAPWSFVVCFDILFQKTFTNTNIQFFKWKEQEREKTKISGA